MAAELVFSATSDKLEEMDWMKSIEICELVALNPGTGKEVVKSIKKRLESKSSISQLYAVMLLEMLMNNVGEVIHKQVIGLNVLPILVKIGKSKANLSLSERIFLLLDATQKSLGGPAGKFPEYFSTYNDLVKAGVPFPEQNRSVPIDEPTRKSDSASNAGKSVQSHGKLTLAKDKGDSSKQELQQVPDSSIIQKARNSLEVLREVLDNIDLQRNVHSMGAKDEFTLDLVEQCSFQKQRVMHLVLTSRNEKLVSQAIELNDQLQKVLDRHDALVSGRPVRRTFQPFSEIEEEEESETEQLFRRRKGKSRAMPEEDLISVYRHHEDLSGLGEQSSHPTPQTSTSGRQVPPTVIPPPPSRRAEREQFFKGSKQPVSSTLDGQTSVAALCIDDASP
ncbi:hypothetical protein MLD38_031529 [Melastoma candidum]|uniref:Uncharacterized protein n=1 Tax=Melastoma candidum TaxID=119954 RepID=A0ACB9MTD8_9MYRT|nr:hypothetical protein MLD38_031529 [Melastoma candidum]